MALSRFGDKAQRPDEAALRAALGEQWTHWSQLQAYVSATYAGSVAEWKCYGTSSGWTLVLKHAKRTILYLFPGTGRFTVLLVFGEKAVAMADQSDLPPGVLAGIHGAVPHTEGRSFQVEVASAAELAVIRELVAIKMGT